MQPSRFSGLNNQKSIMKGQVIYPKLEFLNEFGNFTYNIVDESENSVSVQPTFNQGGKGKITQLSRVDFEAKFTSVSCGAQKAIAREKAATAPAKAPEAETNKRAKAKVELDQTPPSENANEGANDCG